MQRVQLRQRVQLKPDVQERVQAEIVAKRKRLTVEYIATQKKSGRPTYYRPAFCELVTKLRMLGAPIAEICDIIGVSHEAFHNWRQSIPEFKKAWDDGGELADARVVHSLFHKANGYSHKATKIFCSKDGVVTEVEYTEQYPPDTHAGIFWLTNRRRLQWKATSTQELTGPDGAALQPPTIVVNAVAAIRTDK